MQVNFINVGYGDSILIEYKHNNGKFIILIDGGKPDEDHYKNFPGRIRTVDFLREKRIDKINLMVVSHLHEDHVGGLLEVVRNYEVDEMWSNFVFPDELLGRKIDFVCGYDEGASRLLNALNIYNQICCTMTKKRKLVREISGVLLGQNIIGSLKVDVIGPIHQVSKWQKKLIYSIYREKKKTIIENHLIVLNNNINNTSIVIRLINGDKHVLLSGDLYNSYWENILKDSLPIRADILKLSHHGRLDSVSEELIRAISPDHVVISVSNDREDNCPDPEVIKLFNMCSENKEPNFYFTDSVNMLPYSTSESIHKAIVFNLEGDIKYKFI